MSDRQMESEAEYAAYDQIGQEDDSMDDMEHKSLIVLIIDHETFENEMGDGSKFTPEMLHSFGEEANSSAAHWLGYEAWMDCFGVESNVIDLLAGLD